MSKISEPTNPTTAEAALLLTDAVCQLHEHDECESAAAAIAAIERAAAAVEEWFGGCEPPIAFCTVMVADMEYQALRVSQPDGMRCEQFIIGGDSEPYLCRVECERLASALTAWARVLYDRERAGEAWQRIKSRAAETPAQATIWFHGERSFSADGRNAERVSREEFNVLKAFLDKPVSLSTSELAVEGSENVSRTVKKIITRFGADAVRLPGKRGSGYMIRVRTIGKKCIHRVSTGYTTRERTRLG